MKAILCTQYGPPEVLQIGEVEKPTPKDNEIQIKVRATPVTVGDCRIRSFRVPPMFWLAGRLAMGIQKPRNAILGMALAGEVETIGKAVTRFKVGDAVFGCTGHGFGAYAEYRCLPETNAIALKPANLSYQEAAAIPFGGISALYFLRKGNIQRGQKILINGASGSVGVYAVQLAKHFGADVTGVCGPTNLERVKAMGANQVIDYTQEDFTQNGQIYDIIFDAVGTTTFAQCKNSLPKNGYYLHAVMVMAGIKTPWYAMTSGINVVGGTAVPQAEDLAFLAELVEAGTIKPVIDKRYSMEQIVEAHRYVDTGHKKGSVVITIAPDA